MHLIFPIRPVFLLPVVSVLVLLPLFLSAQESEQGQAAYYADYLEGRLTRLGEVYDPAELTCAHRTHPRGTLLRITNLDNGNQVVARVNDRGPYQDGFVVDLSREAARQLDMIASGTARVNVIRVGMAEELPPVQAPPTRAQAYTVTEKGFVPAADPGASLIHTLLPENPGYTVQLGAFSQYENAAESIRARQREGLKEVYLYETPEANGLTRYRVVLGKFESRAEAERRKEELNALSGIQGFVLAFSPSP